MSDKVVVLNGEKVNYDGRIDYSVLASEVTVYGDTREEDILERIQGHRIVVTKEMPLKRKIIEQFPDSVELICEAGTGYNNIDLDAARAKGIQVCNIPAYSSSRVAHTAVMMLLNLSSSMQKQMRMLAGGDKRNFTKCLQVEHVEINGKTLGVIGAGNIGREVIKVGRALGMNILIYTRTPGTDEEGMRYTTFEEVMKNSDYVSLHCPLTPQTKHIINREALELMKPSAFLINTSRGALVDEKALIQALQEQKIAGAGLDVQETEPPAEDNPLYNLENVILTPHMGWKGLETRERLVQILKDNIQGFLSENPQNIVA
ncbi:hydroxyacid dehydrogenase [Lactonifactor longoviformis]|uniref:Glycerate dehydrogenase n=1 Tax=Lactonifactor longoviformis DSM 17459 TaxID=1122155 RepID=A0A1M5ATM0_9CLOT|nr:NAD(P)-dependent oxidoreductase [Lactonifactor longoviformis]POP33581.1 hydroxyacid dehydrogenase [Lactonifactor longoviformis]SHF33447.1 glycerate dehydrogenase [Lactonifactor longoviformis DSM 17459]